MKIMNTHKNILSLLLGLILLSVIKLSFAYNLEIINLNNRPAKDLIPILQPLLVDGASISGEKFVLFVKTSDLNLIQIKTALETLDADYRVLKISVLQESLNMMKRLGYQISGTNKKISASTYSTNRKSNNPKKQVIMVTEGQWASLQTGISVPMLYRTHNANGTVTVATQYQSVYTKLKLFPIINGDKVNMRIQSYTGDKKNVATSTGINTRITGDVGKWIALGGITEATSTSKSGYTFSTQRTSNSMQQIFVKIEITKYQE